MLVVETIAKIRRAFFKQGKPIKAICRELGLSRKVVRKVIRSKAADSDEVARAFRDDVARCSDMISPGVRCLAGG